MLGQECPKNENSITVCPEFATARMPLGRAKSATRCRPGLMRGQRSTSHARYQRVVETITYGGYRRAGFVVVGAAHGRECGNDRTIRWLSLLLQRISRSQFSKGHGYIRPNLGHLISRMRSILRWRENHHIPHQCRVRTLGLCSDWPQIVGPPGPPIGNSYIEDKILS